ncbi:ABC transporter permease [Roseobacter denitrificans]|uniref:Spermidine-ABC transporter, permease component, putative n=1 Tax=Roseobacter denitrificans (strain ATCC 33942 / OCh 114) TaxID=375451 RepID=Q16DE0_ROSDO|nr:ABC transporter permease [Roseobacter denitrificans]ABG30003.1 spermidine-ABC transporter, permease component, putative [Roseobacter denitrificans OCh 114]AVL53209.1 ABC transporter permease [Roseobacter denitrificans]SFF68620.1 spermidine/putrescine transport system permease protein [Roseobacter denitrificans OCh 114]
MRRGNRILLSCIYWAFVLYVFVPLLLMILMGFKDSKFIGFPIRSWTLDWYMGVFVDAELLSTLGYSVTIAILSTLISVVVGTWIAVLLEGRKFIGRAAVFGLTLLPALVPGIISAIAFRIYARWLGIEPGMGAIIWAHAVHNVPFVVLVVMARLSTLPKSQIEAARDLGADPIIAFLRITVPYLIPAILGASIFCLLLSFDDFVRSFFLGGYEPTLPVLIFAMLRSGMSPEINAIATVALVLTAAIGIWAERFTRRMNRDTNP